MRTFILIVLGFIGLHTNNLAISFIMGITILSVLLLNKEIDRK